MSTWPRNVCELTQCSVGAGVAYGCAFTMLCVYSCTCTGSGLFNILFDTHRPSLVSAVWGLHNLGRNYGILTYAPFLGTPVFSYLYAFVAAGHAPADGGVCTGVHCWRTTFEVSGVVATLALAATLWLWKAWKGKV